MLVSAAALIILSAALSPIAAQPTPSRSTKVAADALAPFSGDFAEIRLDGKKQFLHRSGRIMVDKLEQYGAPICIAVKHGAYGAINQKGDVIADFMYDRIYYEYDDNGKTGDDTVYDYFLAIVQHNGKYGAVDTLGTVIADPRYDELRPINRWVIAAQQAGKWGLLSLKDGRKVLPFEYDDLDKTYVLDGRIEVTVGNKVGLRSADARRELLPAIYDAFHVLPLSGDTLIAAKQGENTLLLDTLGHTVAVVQYDRVQADGDQIRVEQAGKRGWLTAGGDVILSPKYDESAEWRTGLCVVSQDGRKGVVANDGKTVLPCRYSGIRILDNQGGTPEAPAILVEDQGKWGLFDTMGHPILPVRYDNIQLAEAGPISYVWAVEGDHYRIFDRKGQVLTTTAHRLPPNGVAPSVQGAPADATVVALPDGERVGLYDLEKKQWILEPEYPQLEWQLGSFIKATRYPENEYTPVTAYFTSEGNQLIAPTKYLSVNAVDTDRYVVKEIAQGQWKTTLFDRSGKRLYSNKVWDFDAFRFNKLLVPHTRSFGQEIGHFQSGLLKVAAEDNLFADRLGREHRFEDADYVGDFYNGMAIAAKSFDGTERIGIIDTAGNIVLPLLYTDMDKLYDSDLIRVSNGEKTGLIDITGNVRIEALYDQIDRIERKEQGDLFNVRRDGKAGVVDDHGRVIIPPEYENIRFHGTFFVVTAQEKKGLLACDGTVLAAPKYDEIHFNDSYYGYFPALVKQGDDWTYIDPRNGEQPFSIVGKIKLGY